MSDIIQVDDTQKWFLNPVNRQIGEHWMTCVVGCSLGGIAAQSQGNFPFHVNDSTTSVIKDLVCTPTNVNLNHMLDSTISAEETSSSSEWTPQSGRQRSLHIDV